MLHDATANLNYSYDQENRITGAAGYTYTYDGDGNRVEKSNGSTGTLYWYMSPGIVAESDLVGNLKSEYVFFDGERVARKDFPGLAVSYYFSDHLKTTDIVTDASGNIKNESDFYPWGGELEFLANDSNHYKFTGKERDSETGLDYFGARYYSNGLGRFITPDWAAKATAVPYAEFADPQSLNLYSYVRNVPTVKVDPDGHAGCTVDNEKHGSFWCFLHKIGITETQREEADRDRAYLKEQGLVVVDRQGKPVDSAKVPDAEIIDLRAKHEIQQLMQEQRQSAADLVPFMTQWGWNNSRAYRQARAQLEQPGTHEDLNGKVPTREEATRMIEENGGKVIRSEGAHGADSVSEHKYPHINYETSSGVKATVRVKE